MPETARIWQKYGHGRVYSELSRGAKHWQNSGEGDKRVAVSCHELQGNGRNWGRGGAAMMRSQKIAEMCVCVCVGGGGGMDCPEQPRGAPKR